MDDRKEAKCQTCFDTGIVSEVVAYDDGTWDEYNMPCPDCDTEPDLDFL